jgi:hypothetical protein
VSVIWADGFDHYGTIIANLTSAGSYSETFENGPGGITLSTTEVRTGTHSLKLDGNAISDAFAAGIRKAFPNGALVSFGVAFAAFLPELPDSTPEQRINFRDFSNTSQFDVRIATTGALQAVRADGTVLGTTAGPVITAGAWNHFEIFATMSQAAGVIKIRVNNTEVLNLTGIDNVNTALVECSQFYFLTAGKASGAATSAWYIDDLYIYDTNGAHANAYPVGDLGAYRLTATADTLEADWALSSGAQGFALIDEATPDDADYIYADAATDRSDFGMTDLPVDITYIETLFGHNRMLKSDAGPAQVQFSLMQGASQAAGTDRAITTSATYWFDNLPTDPLTAAKWTRSGVNSAQLRYDRTA